MSRSRIWSRRIAVASMLAAGGVLLGGAAPAPAQLPPAGCGSAESRQFDFWVGRWQVSPTGYPKMIVAHSLIEKLYQGCAVRENWSPSNGRDGGSLSSFVAADPGWRQTWVGSSGVRVDFKGGWNGRAMVLTGVWPQPGHPNQLTRMTYTPAADGSVRQAGETSNDGGATWTASFDFTYRRAAG
ncbi:MAG TPA: hypothetical protein VGG29_05205 [Caulobacteraceae bacterium]